MTGGQPPTGGAPEPDPPPFRPLTSRPTWGDGDVIIAEDGVGALTRKVPGPVTLADRQGTFVHSFTCWECDLEFAVFSWRGYRHHAGTVACPECRRVTPKVHWAAQVSGSTTFNHTGASPEIWTWMPLFGGQLMDDSDPPPSHQFEGDA